MISIVVVVVEYETPVTGGAYQYWNDPSSFRTEMIESGLSQEENFMGGRSTLRFAATRCRRISLVL